ncbi:maleylpyruvate isomerase family mycothiol-dependent enzyme [Amycolatopsis sp. H20-H5]|uniref:maleylpyruvate isomerase family mycothiol-dependent enzyme n=1 Tax=Amycolatopsis sp. H20-H5 TaxID=3046309 RepID=UPI002DB9AC4C|nr:maleylpyruvate isomerase family mycothiol-dependent enzyme [Amycolatopsis sp. H20-H5]MEC3982405.1 maleylpyruvate isomerase family mycothiol-dependent enzyme [Amycolatopsis sp. H20-H5]
MSEETSDLSRTLGWLAAGTAFLHAAVDRIPDDGLREPSGLPGWSRAHVVAHLARNAEALGRLAGWARTGVETPMYVNAQARNADIEASAVFPADVLREELAATSAGLDDALALLDDDTWQAAVRNAQGQSMPATTIPWMRTRETWLHTVDLAAGATVADLPADLLDALLGDVTTALSAREGCPAAMLEPDDRTRSWRLGEAGGPVVAGSAASLVAWLTGRAPRQGAQPELASWI